MFSTRFITPPQSDLVAKTRQFWFDNVPGTMSLDGHIITRQDIYVYGGPNPWFTHPLSQKMEWLSRIQQANLFEPHSSPEEELCKTLCERQGEELWTNCHQNFDFALGCDPKIGAPRGILVLPDKLKHYGGTSSFERFQNPRCEQLNLVLKRRLARSCQMDVADRADGIDWSKYHFLFTFNLARNPRFARPDLPVILYCHDMWLGDTGYQDVIDWLQPDILLTAYPSPWRENMRLGEKTRVAFAPFAPSMFFSRPNLNPEAKTLDLLVIGNLRHAIYTPRIILTAQIRPLAERYRIEFSHAIGCRRNVWKNGTIEPSNFGPICYLNQWSAYLGSARFVMFGGLASAAHQFVLGKYYETLASGAIPIVPEVPDLKLLGISPFEHYIPLSEVEGRNERLAYFLDHYEDYSYVAENAVAWAVANMDRMLFDDFETLVHEITGEKYPKRLIN